LIEQWGMTHGEATGSSSRKNPADLCILLRSKENVRMGVLFIDSPEADTFGDDGIDGEGKTAANRVALKLECAEEVKKLANAVAETLAILNTGPRLRIENNSK